MKRLRALGDYMRKEFACALKLTIIKHRNLEVVSVFRNSFLEKWIFFWWTLRNCNNKKFEYWCSHFKIGWLVPTLYEDICIECHRNYRRIGVSKVMKGITCLPLFMCIAIMLIFSCWFSHVDFLEEWADPSSEIYLRINCSD